MTAQSAAYIGKLIENECRGWGDQSAAIERIARQTGVSKWTIEHLRKGRAKTVSAAIKEALRRAYLEACQRQITRLQHELALERAMGGHPGNLDDLEDEARLLAAKIAAAKTRPLP